MTHTPQRPLQEETAEYYHTYIRQVPGNDFLQLLKDGKRQMMKVLHDMPPDKWDYRYAPGKWTAKEVLLHLIDTERIMAYRALRIARNDQTPLPGFEQDDYIPFCNAADRLPESIISEYEAVRNATVQLFAHLDDIHLGRKGTASNNPFTPRALGFIIVGHQIHHLQVLNERYLD